MKSSGIIIQNLSSAISTSFSRIMVTGIVIPIFAIVFLCPVCAVCARSYQDFLHIADAYYDSNKIDSALIYYDKVIDVQANDKNERAGYSHAIVRALNRAGTIYMDKGNYNVAYKYLIDALLVCEQNDILSEQSRIYNNLGNIYYHFKKYETAKSYYHKALGLCRDSLKAGYYNNLGEAMAQTGKTDSALLYFNKSLEMCKRYNNNRLFALYNSMASLYRKMKNYDQAFRYYRLSLVESRKSRRIKHEAQNLSDLGSLFLDIEQLDSAKYYIGLSDEIAERNRFLKILVANDLLLSKLEELRGNGEKAFYFYKQYATLQDSVFNTNVFGDITQLQRYYDTLKTKQHISRLEMEKRDKERTVWLTLGILILVCAALLYIYMQKRRLNKAYDALVEKNIEINRYQEKEKSTVKTTNNVYDGIFDKILTVMDDKELICNPDFSIEKLAVAVQSNHTYVSRAIKNATGKSFRSFLSDYRIREAQRVLSESDAAKYTIESVALMVGFKSRSTFHDVFKEITGVSPKFYIKSVRERHKME